VGYSWANIPVVPSNYGVCLCHLSSGGFVVLNSVAVAVACTPQACSASGLLNGTSAQSASLENNSAFVSRYYARMDDALGVTCGAVGVYCDTPAVCPISLLGAVVFKRYTLPSGACAPDLAALHSTSSSILIPLPNGSAGVWNFSRSNIASIQYCNWDHCNTGLNTSSGTCFGPTEQLPPSHLNALVEGVVGGGGGAIVLGLFIFTFVVLRQRQRMHSLPISATPKTEPVLTRISALTAAN
jgi:hypothetical protein